MKSIILVHPAGIGDAIEDFILIKSILKYNRNIKIHYIGNYFINDLLKLINIKTFDTTIIEKKSHFGFRDVLNFKNIKALLKTPKYYDLVYIMPGINLRKASALKYILRPKEFVGGLLGYPHKNIENIVPSISRYDNIDYGIEKQHRLISNKQILSKYLRIESLDFNIFDYSIFDNEYSKDYSDLTKPYVVIHIGSSNKFPARSLSIKQWKKLTNELLLTTPYKLLFIGSRNEKPIIKHIINSKKWKNYNNRLKNLAGTTAIKDLFFLLKNSEVVISTDSGPGQIAGVMKKKQIMLFGPTSHSIANPINSNCIKIFRDDQCSPCYGTNLYDNCPYDNKCMEKVGIKTIMYAFNKLNDIAFENKHAGSDYLERVII
tara:strand:+ start:29409 stop:30533 length:1125 start_codon:yes stop_codon:yes gene_type:complete